MGQKIKKLELENFGKQDEEKILITIPEFRNKSKGKVFILFPEYENKENKVEKKVKGKKKKKKITIIKETKKTNFY